MFNCLAGNNPKIEVVEDRYQFRPPYKLRDKKGLIKLLKRRDLNGEGGVMYDDIIESLGESQEILMFSFCVKFRKLFKWF
jgi:transcription initiation factor TFIIE subunit beta